MKINKIKMIPVPSSKKGVIGTDIGGTKSAFTLVELIVVITILAILGTIAFISLQGYSATSRDSVRISDVSSIKTTLEIFQIDAGKYPLPDDGSEFTYLGDLLWTQGTFGKTVVSNLSRSFSKAPRDPLSDKEYIYSRAGNGNEFQILNLLEGDISLNTTVQTNAIESVRRPILGGTYNGLYIKTKNYIVPVPSIITSEELFTGSGYELTQERLESLVISGRSNIPKVGNINYSTGGLDGFVLSATGVVTSESSDTEKASVMTAIQNTYSGSSLKNEGIYKYVLSLSGEKELANALEFVVLNNSAGKISDPIILSTTVSGVCTSLPSNALYYNSTTSYSLSSAANGTTLVATTAGYSGSPSSNTCEYKCNGGYTWNGSSCQLPLVSGSCTSLPSNALYYNGTTSYSLSSAANGTTLVATTAGYNSSPSTNTCEFKCNTGRIWDLSSCILSTSGEQVYSTPGTYSWTVPSGITSVSVVCVGAGSAGGYGKGGNGGALAYKNNILVTSGSSYTVVVGLGSSGTSGTSYSIAGGKSYFKDINTVNAGGGGSSSGLNGGLVIAGIGGKGGTYGSSWSGGGGAGGYQGDGGKAGYGYSVVPGTGNGGGGSGGGSMFINNRGGGGGGGVGLYGLGLNGICLNNGPWGTNYGSAGSSGGGGSGGSNGIEGGSTSGGSGGFPGGGGGAGRYTQSSTSYSQSGSGGNGSCRIIWPGDTRQFPSTNVD